jgi:uncharacterized protein YbbC (DUF1343 family)
MALAMESARAHHKKFFVLDRPNPINGLQIEGNLHEFEFHSFVGMYPIPMRHGLTVGELAQLFNKEFGIGCDLEVVKMEGWQREMFYEATELPWVLPSPNMPTIDTAVVYPGAVMVEGTLLSEGRGTTKPFEVIGAPYINPYEVIQELKKEPLPGVIYRPLHFQPTFHKFAGELCGGLQLHVTDRLAFKPVITSIAILSAIHRLYPEKFAWKEPPYEYVFNKLPFDVINGSATICEQIQSAIPIAKIEEGWQSGLEEFAALRKAYLLYD